MALNGKKPLRLSQSGTVTTRDLAQALKVNQSTVSRALNGAAEIGPELAKRVRDLAREMGYRPQPIRTKRKQAVGLIIASDRNDGPDNQFMSRVILAVEEVCSEHGQHVNLAFIRRDETPTPSVPAMIAQNRVDGVLVAGHPPASFIARAREFDLPIVAVNDVATRLAVPCVRFDPSQATRDAIIGLSQLGHRRIAVALHRLAYPTNRFRYQAYLQTMDELGLRVPDAWRCVDLPKELNGGHRAVERLFALPDPPTALLCGNDWMALGAYHALLSRGLRVPEDVSIVGHDNLWFTNDPTLRLTTIHRDERLLVEQAVTLLLETEKSQREQTCEKLVHAEVVWRGSTAAAPRNAKGGESGPKSARRTC